MLRPLNSSLVMSRSAGRVHSSALFFFFEPFDGEGQEVREGRGGAIYNLGHFQIGSLLTEPPQPYTSTPYSGKASPGRTGDVALRAIRLGSQEAV